MIYKDGTITVVSGSSIVTGKGTKWNSNNPLVSPGMLMLIKNGDVNYPYMILSVNSDTELNLADKLTFSATDTTYTINLTEPENNSDAARALVAANTYIIYFLQNMDLWMTENGVVEITLPSGKTVKLESIKALQELVEGKADASSVKEIKDALESKADATKVDEISKSVTEISKTVENKLDKINIVQVTGSATDKVMSQKASTDILAKKNSNENLNCGNLKVQTPTDYTSIIFAKGDKTSVMLETSTSTFNLIYRDSNNTNQSVIRFPFGVNGTVQLLSSFTIDSNGYLKRASKELRRLLKFIMMAISKLTTNQKELMFSELD